MNLKSLLSLLSALVLCFLALPGGGHPAPEGRSSRLPPPPDPRRVVTLAPSLTEIVYALGQEHRLAGVSQDSDFPEGAKTLPKVGSYVQPDLERILALQPDLCLGATDSTPAPLVARLEDLKVPVLLVHPRSLDEVVRTVEHIGRVLGAEARADSLAAELRERLRRVRERVATAPVRPRVFFQIGVTPLVAVGEGTFIHELIVTAGGRNMIKGPAPYPQVGLEQVLAGRPEVIIVTTMARGVDMERVLAGWRSYPALPAVRLRRVHVVDSDIFDRPGPRLVEGLEILARLLHPELWASEGKVVGGERPQGPLGPLPSPTGRAGPELSSRRSSVETRSIPGRCLGR